MRETERVTGSGTMIYGTDNVSEKPLVMQVTQNRVTAADSLGPNDGPVTDWEDH